MPRTKLFCACLLAAVLLIPSISSHDDAIRLSTFKSGIENSQGNALVSARGFVKSDLDPTLATLLDALDSIHIGDACTFQFDFTSAPLLLNEHDLGCNRSVAAPVGRAPPV
jgi:hypothetical protein